MKEATQIHRITWNKIDLVINYTPHQYGGIISHLEIRSECPNPISMTGYRSHFCPVGEIEQVSVSVADYVIMWLNENSQTEEWQKHLSTICQPSFFG